MSAAVLRSPPHLLLVALCAGIVFANAMRLPTAAALGGLALVGACAAGSNGRGLVIGVCALGLTGWWWGSERLDRLDHSVLLSQVGRAERVLVVVTAQPRRGKFDVKLPVQVRR